MSMEGSRRARFTNVAPTAGEFTVAVLLAGLFFILITPLVVQGGVAWATSGGFALPNGHLLDAYAGLLQGRFGAGLHRGVADTLPVQTRQSAWAGAAANAASAASVAMAPKRQVAWASDRRRAESRLRIIEASQRAACRSARCPGAAEAPTAG